MAIERQALCRLDECINAYIDESEQSIHKYYKLFNLAIRALDELGLDFFYQIKSVKIPINPNFTANLPSDCLRYTKIGILNGYGEVIPLAHNKQLTTYADLMPNRLSKTQDPTIYPNLNCSGNVWNNYWYNGTYMTLYGLPSGAPFVGSFKIDETNGVILLNETFAFDYLIVEYVASPVEGQEYYLPLQFKEAVIAYLAWKDIRSMPTTRKGSLGDKRDRRHEYFNERRLAYARYTPFYPEEAHQLNMESTRLTVKI